MVKGRIIKGIGGLYYVSTDQGVYRGQAKGIFRKRKITPLIGDFVGIDILDEEEKSASIAEIYERKNELLRPRVSNVDQVIIVFAIKSPNINLDLLDRFIVLAEEVGTDIVICLNKTDLATDDEIESLKKIYEDIGYKIFSISTTEKLGMVELENTLRNKVTVFAGPSGVGKSSIVNLILPLAEMEIGEISKKIGRGKHTTRHSELFELWENTYIVDSPGFTSLTLDKIKKEELQHYFKEFSNFIGQCKFNDCTHNKEIGCKIKEEVGKSISEKRYKRYLQFLSDIG